MILLDISQKLQIIHSS